MRSSKNRPKTVLVTDDRGPPPSSQPSLKKYPGIPPQVASQNGLVDDMIAKSENNEVPTPPVNILDTTVFHEHDTLKKDGVNENGEAAMTKTIIDQRFAEWIEISFITLCSLILSLLTN